jgi:hypothetical protein
MEKGIFGTERRVGEEQRRVVLQLGFYQYKRRAAEKRE